MTNYPQADQDLTTRVKEIMHRDHTGYENRISRRDLVLKVLNTINDDSDDRKLRDALSQLPVIWYNGYFIPTIEDQDKVDAYTGGNVSRIRNLGRKNWIVERYLREQAEPVQVEQMELAL
jgi:hypothetical protein